MNVAAKAFVLRSLLLAAVVYADPSLLRGQSETPPPPTLPILNADKLEVELVEAHDSMGIPAEIHRKAGRFILAITNRSKNPDAWFVVDAAPAVTNIVSAVGHVLTIGSGKFERKRRTGAVFVALPGTYQLKYGVSGTLICTIVIE